MLLIHVISVQVILVLSQVCLWGNKCDLSISAGMENSQVSCPLAQVDTLREYVLINDLDLVWNQLQ
ncbi:hypothetical protein DPMN_087500 [Dreissena polymorpha]|uniref:Damage-control phosphatase ARMT1-like metal-binding domain-containing protein n=1 Tax=Dreissena polymorpha TaxID=45954 RepID=A0A9D4KSH9_DREPO|nr:hypothetical protein DPMN_087500 [Dreissena polymorpha]